MSYLTGPAIVRRGGVSIYFENGLTRAVDTKTGKVASDFHGKAIDTYMISRMITISGKPVDAIANLSTIFGLGISNIGESIFKGTARTITSISLANPGVVTFAAAHNLGPAGTTITGTIAGVAGGIAPSTVNDTHTLTIINATTASCGVNVTSAGTGGTFTPDSEPLQIVSKNDNAIYTFERGGIYAPPKIHLGAAKGFFAGDLQFAVLGSVAKTPTATDYWQSAVSAAFSDTTFDETKIKRYRYTATYDSFTGLRGQDGFDISIDYGKEEIHDDNYGIGDIILTDVTAGVNFVPISLTQAQMDQLIRLQDTDALRPGDSVAGAGAEDLVITGADDTTGFELSLYGVGFHDAKIIYGVGKARQGEVVGISKRTWATGVANPLYAFTVS